MDIEAVSFVLSSIYCYYLVVVIVARKVFNNAEPDHQFQKPHD